MSSPRLLFSPASNQRIAAMSAALSLHLLGFAVLLAPRAPLPEAQRIVPPAPTLVDIVRRVAPTPPPVPPPPQPPPRQLVSSPSMPTPMPLPVVIESPSPVSIPLALPRETAPSVSTSEHSAQTPAVATLRYLRAPPPPYPALARRRGQEGEVLLRVEVDAQGRVQAVTIQRSSGHRLLDEAARDQVRTRWRFEPAMREGRPVPALAEVPVLFRIDAI